VTNTIDRPFAVEVIVEKVVYVDRIKEVEKIVTKLIETVR
jgi:hypothetical protein